MIEHTLTLARGYAWGAHAVDWIGLGLILGTVAACWVWSSYRFCASFKRRRP